MKRPPSTAGRMSERGMSWDCERPRSELSKPCIPAPPTTAAITNSPPCAKIQSSTRRSATVTARPIINPLTVSSCHDTLAARNDCCEWHHRRGFKIVPIGLASALEKFAVLMACACHGQDRQRRKDDGPVEMRREEPMGGSEHKRAGKERVPGYPDRDDGDQRPSNCRRRIQAQAGGAIESMSRIVGEQYSELS
jgi:hypothetical protein